MVNKKMSATIQIQVDTTQSYIPISMEHAKESLKCGVQICPNVQGVIDILQDLNFNMDDSIKVDDLYEIFNLKDYVAIAARVRGIQGLIVKHPLDTFKLRDLLEIKFISNHIGG